MDDRRENVVRMSGVSIRLSRLKWRLSLMATVVAVVMDEEAVLDLDGLDGLVVVIGARLAELGSGEKVAELVGFG